MRSPWLDIPLPDYERHMALPAIGQAQMLADELQFVVRQHRPKSVAVAGCAGGNGFERMADANLERLVGIDINPRYIEATARRFQSLAPKPELHIGDIESSAQFFEPVELIYAALVFEYVHLSQALHGLSRHCRAGGILAALVQRPHVSAAAVSPSPYASLQQLEPAIRLVSIAALRSEAAHAGFALLGSKTVISPAGKQFAVEVFRHRTAAPAGEARSSP